MFDKVKYRIKQNRLIEKCYLIFKQLCKRNITTKADLKTKVDNLQNRLDWFIAHAEITTLKPATGYLRKKQLSLVNFANEFFSDVAPLNIHPFLICGNLIGALRHKGYVPWDDDLDFGLIRSEYDALIDYCKQNFHVTVYNGKWSEYNTDKHLRRMDQLVKQYPNEYILDIWVDQIQIMRGTSAIDRLAIDFWSFDYYAEDYDIKEHVKYLNELSLKKKNIDYVDKIVQYLNDERTTNKNISFKSTGLIFPGIDNVEGFLRAHRTSNWLKTGQLYPLKLARFESTQYYVPNKIEDWLAYEYPDYMSYPPDAGQMPHEGYKEKYITEHMPTVEFFLVDAFEIFHFLPLYSFFENNGIFSQFVAEKPIEENAWFNYDEAIKILEEEGLRYKTKSNYNTDFAFTTQDLTHIKRYKNKKVHMCYGMSLTNYSFCESSRTIKGFDLKLVHGNTSYNIVKKKNKNLSLIKVGYPKYTPWGKRTDLGKQEEKELFIFGKNKEKKQILLYFPTWDTGSSIEKYEVGFQKLKEKYFIVTKAHHCTFRLPSEKKRLQILQSISDVILEGNYSFEDAAKMSNLVICDAISGAATEVPYLNPNAKLILLKSPVESKNSFKDFFERFAMSVDSPEDLLNAVTSILEEDSFKAERKKIIDDLYSKDFNRAFNQLRTYIIENCKKKEIFH